MNPTLLPVSIKALLLDDEQDACKNLEIILKRYWKHLIEVVGKAYDTHCAEAMIRQSSPDVLFIDIEMPGENAFQFLDRIDHRDFEIIFVTAYDEYALRALKLNAVDYILKPISIDELRLAIGRLQERLLMKQLLQYAEEPPGFQAIYTHINKREIPQNIVLRNRDRALVIPFSAIHYLEAEGSYSRFYFDNGDPEKSTIMSYPLSYYEEILPKDIFYRTHKSYLVNVSHVLQVHKTDQYTVEMGNHRHLPLSRRRYHDLMTFLKTKYA